MAALQQIGVNLVAVRSQCMSVDLRTNATYFYMLESQKNKGRSKVEHAGKNNTRRSTLGNVFNRLGRGADMRDTLNRRREQERS